MKIFIVIVILLLSNKIQACSFVQMIKDFNVNQTLELKVIPTKPNFKVISITRGSDDGNGGSCSDAGIISLKRLSKPKLPTGYIFEITEGLFKGGIFYPKPIIATKEFEGKGLYSFIWFDDSSQKKEPLEFKVNIIAVSESGDKSEPQILQIAQSEIH